MSFFSHLSSSPSALLRPRERSGRCYHTCHSPVYPPWLLFQIDESQLLRSLPHDIVQLQVPVSHTMVTPVAQDGQYLQQKQNNLLLPQQPVLLLTPNSSTNCYKFLTHFSINVPHHPYPIVRPISTEGEDFVYIGWGNLLLYWSPYRNSISRGAPSVSPNLDRRAFSWRKVRYFIVSENTTSPSFFSENWNKCQLPLPDLVWYVAIPYLRSFYQSHVLDVNILVVLASPLVWKSNTSFTALSWW